MGTALKLGYADRLSSAGLAFNWERWTAPLLVAAALLLRLPQLGDPTYHIDDQFYLLVGRSLTHGDLPYVDIWDRKPLGLFLLYGGISLLGGAGVLEYQLVAALFAAATAIVIARIASRFATSDCAIFAGVCYLTSLGSLGGGGGQSPVFYNLFIAGAALLTLDALRLPDTIGLLRNGVIAMMLAGLAIFVKPTALVEGSFFGICLLVRFWMRARSPSKVAGLGLIFACCGIGPTAAAFLGYASLGHADDFWFANFVSIFLKKPLAVDQWLPGAGRIFLTLLPLALVAAAGLRRLLRQAGSQGHLEVLFLEGWLGAALGGFLIIPNFFDHYALSLLVPMSLAAAPMFARGSYGRVPSFVPIVWALSLSSYPNYAQTRASTATFNRMAQVVVSHLGGGCLYIYEGPVQLYTATGACRLTKFLFPDHLRSASEVGAIGVDPQLELRRVLAAHPTVIVTADEVFLPDNPNTRQILHDELARSYRRVATVVSATPGFRQHIQIWTLRSAH